MNTDSTLCALCGRGNHVNHNQSGCGGSNSLSSPCECVIDAAIADKQREKFARMVFDNCYCGGDSHKETCSLYVATAPNHVNDAIGKAARIAYDMIVSGRSAKEVSIAILALRGKQNDVIA